jgi:hypothetical protein
MTSQEFIRKISVLLIHNPASECLDDILARLHQAHEVLRDAIYNITMVALGTGEVNNAITGFQGLLKTVSSEIRPLRTREVWVGVEDLR